MSVTSDSHPDNCLARTCADASAIRLIVEGKPHDLGDFTVRRVMPVVRLRSLGPFVFFDHMGPATFPAGRGIDVRPHPHIHLATVTYLFEGAIMHRDSLGSEQIIAPGAVNWMVAGRGIVHSERSPADRTQPRTLEGLQLWLALPQTDEDTEPSFAHHPAASLPTVRRDEATITVLAGSAYGATAPARTFSPLFYLDVRLPAGATLELPSEFQERGLYLLDGEVGCAAETLAPGQLAVFHTNAEAAVTAKQSSRFVLLGGAPLDGPRHMWWNFVSSSQERIEQAKSDWREGRFANVPGDENEFIPLPEG